MKKFELWFPIKPYTVTQGFGENAEYYSKNIPGLIAHNGQDAVAYDGQLIRSAHNGIVTFTGEDGKGGLGVVVRTTEEFENTLGEPSYWKSIYWHVKPNTFKVKPGDLVKAGDVLAGADNTGFSTGTHLHCSIKAIQRGEADWQWFNINQNNGYFGCENPEPYWNKFYAEDASKVLSIYTQMLTLLKQAVEVLKQGLKK